MAPDTMPKAIFGRARRRRAATNVLETPQLLSATCDSATLSSFCVSGLLCQIVLILRMTRDLKIGDARKRIPPSKDASLCFLRCLPLGSFSTK